MTVQSIYAKIILSDGTSASLLEDLSLSVKVDKQLSAVSAKHLQPEQQIKVRADIPKLSTSLNPQGYLFLLELYSEQIVPFIDQLSASSPPSSTETQRKAQPAQQIQQIDTTAQLEEPQPQTLTSTQLVFHIGDISLTLLEEEKRAMLWANDKEQQLVLPQEGDKKEKMNWYPIASFHINIVEVNMTSKSDGTMHVYYINPT